MKRQRHLVGKFETPNSREEKKGKRECLQVDTFHINLQLHTSLALHLHLHLHLDINLYLPTRLELHFNFDGDITFFTVSLMQEYDDVVTYALDVHYRSRPERRYSAMMPLQVQLPLGMSA